MFHNVMVGYPIVALSDLIPPNEFNETLVTSTRYLPKILVEAGIVKSTSEVRRNRKDLDITFPDDMIDCITVKWGKKFLYIVIGKKEPVDLISEYFKDESFVAYSTDTVNWEFKPGFDPNENSRIYEEKFTLNHVFENGAEIDPYPLTIYILLK